MQRKDIQPGVCYSFEPKYYSPSRAWVLDVENRYHETRRWWNRYDTDPFSVHIPGTSGHAGHLVLISERQNPSQEDVEWASQLTAREALGVRSENGYGRLTPRADFKLGIVALRLIMGEWDARQVQLAQEEQRRAEAKEAKKVKQDADFARMSKVADQIKALGGRDYYISPYDRNTALAVTLEDLELLVRLAREGKTGD